LVRRSEIHRPAKDALTIFTARVPTSPDKFFIPTTIATAVKEHKFHIELIASRTVVPGECESTARVVPEVGDVNCTRRVAHVAGHMQADGKEELKEHRNNEIFGLIRLRKHFNPPNLEGRDEVTIGEFADPRSLPSSRGIVEDGIHFDVPVNVMPSLTMYLKARIISNT
jgi:hypothetical protein